MHKCRHRHCYEFFHRQSEEVRRRTISRFHPGLIAHLDRMLEPKGYFLPESRADATRRTLRGVLTKPGWNHLEVRTLRGVLSSLERRPRDNSD